jgi:hypothetical protein
MLLIIPDFNERFKASRERGKVAHIACWWIDFR